MTYEIDARADPDAIQAAVRQGIRTADPPNVPPRDWQVVSLALRDAHGAIVGGLYGATMWCWLMIDGLWVDAAHRGQGLGSRLLVAAEELAVSRGCRGAWLGTFDFQAREFYRRHGYAVFATLPDFPPGRAHFHLWKALAPSQVEFSGEEPA